MPGYCIDGQRCAKITSQREFLKPPIASAKTTNTQSGRARDRENDSWVISKIMKSNRDIRSQKLF